MSKLLMCLNASDSKKLCPLLHQNGFEVTSTSDTSFALKLLGEGRFSLILLENIASVYSAFLKEIPKHPHMNGILLTQDSLSSPCPYSLGLIGSFELHNSTKLLGFIKQYTKVLEHQDLLRHHLVAGKKEKDHEVVFASKSMKTIYDNVKKIAKTQSSVLITGESGTGKEVIAKLIHDESFRSSSPFVAINSCAISPQLLESELFGYEKGAFTGALSRKIGRLEYANHGTFFFDEIAEAPLELQAKLLRVLQERCFERVGGLESIKLNVRFIAATNRNLEEAVSSKLFREDLYYRLNVVPLHLPPLRERVDDILPLAHSFLKNFCQKNNLEPMELSHDARQKLLDYPWPGNVRELFNVLERSSVMSSSSVLKAQDIFIDHKKEARGLSEESFELATVEQKTIARALEATDFNKTQAAKLLGISLKTLRAKIQAQVVLPD